jgi:phage gp16-like protein
MTDAEIKKLFPKATDAKKLVELMTIVKSAQTENDKINAIVANSEKFAGVVVTLLGKFI